MKGNKHMKTVTNTYTAFALFALACFALSPIAEAVDDGNTKHGKDALKRNTTGTNDTALGYQALYSNTTGVQNTATGSQALYSNTSGIHNTANGYQGLYSNTTGERNTACGRRALLNNTTGNSNTANGYAALVLNTTGGGNTASGAGALFSNSTAFYNVAFGDATLFSNTTGEGNTAFGTIALQVNTTGNYNTALGFGAGNNLDTGNNNIAIGNLGVAGESNTIRIGGDVGVGYGSQTAAFVAGISGTAVVGDAVVVDGNGQLGTVASSARFKEEIKPMDKTSEAILALKPVTFRYKHAIDSKGKAQFGLIAEQVAKVNPDLVVRDRKGEIYSVRYEAVNAMLLNEFLKAHRKIQEQQATITQLRSTLAKQERTDADQQQQIEALTAGLQKVSSQLEMNRPGPQMVADSQ